MQLPNGLRYYWDRFLVDLKLLLGPLWPRINLCRTDMTGKTVIVTGSNAGIGFEIAEKFASMNATVVLACRNIEKAAFAKKQILNSHPSCQVHCLPLDQASFASVKAFAAGWDLGRINLLYHNAGQGWPVDEDHQFTEDGLEFMYQVNFLSSFLLTHLLEPHLASRARVILTSSAGGYNGALKDDFVLGQTTQKIEVGFHTTCAGAPYSKRYFTNKLMQNTFCKTLQEHFDHDRSTKRLVHSFEPSLVHTKMILDISSSTSPNDGPYKFVAWLGTFTGIGVEQGAATGVWLGVTEDPAAVQDHRRCFWSANVPRLTQADFYSQEKLDKLWLRWSAHAGVSWIWNV